jgi:hypothetical protein
MVDELLSRRSVFRHGRKIRLADGQAWTFPAPITELEWNAAPFGAEYTGLIRAIIEAENASDQHVAELAFAIFLLGHNYCLSSTDYGRLLDFDSASRDSTDGQSAFHRISQDHLHSLSRTSCRHLDSRPDVPTSGKFSRLVVWLRNHSPFRWWSVDSRSC